MSAKVKRLLTVLFSALFVATIMVTPSSTAYMDEESKSWPEIKEFEASGVFVNPKSQNLKVAYYLTENAYVSASVLNDDQKVVNMLFANDFQGKGYNNFTYSGKDEDGNYVKSGDYVLQLYAYNDKGSFTYKHNFSVEYNPLDDDDDDDYNDPDNDNDYDDNDDDNDYTDPDSSETKVIMQESGPYSFNPLQDNFKIKFELNYDEQVTVEILSSGKVVRTLMKKVWKDSNTVYTVTWNGKNDSGAYVDEGKYKYRITLGNGNQYYGDLAVNYKGDNPYDDDDSYEDDDSEDDDDDDDDSSLNVYNLQVKPTVFDPKASSIDTKISYYLSEKATDVHVHVMKKNGTHVRDIVKNQSQNAGYHSFTFNGKDDDGDWLPEDSYTVEVKAKKSGETDSEKVTVSINYGYSNDDDNDIDPKVSKYGVDPKEFDPEEEKTKITYHTNDNGYVTMKIMDGSKLIRTLIDNDYKNEGDHAHLWDGKNNYGQYVAEGTYQVAIWFYTDEGDDYVKTNVEVDYGKYISTYTDPYPTPKKIKVLSDGDTYNYDYYDYSEPAEKCAGFNDVNTSSKYCEAIKFVKENQIFNGYNNGYFYPNKAIQRDEALRVVMETFNLSTMPADGSNLGFKDVTPYAWYMPYLRAAKSLGIIHGYPDGYFRPYQSINRVEFTKVFVETAQDADGVSIPDCNVKPYVDTPLTWYTDYVCYAKQHNLIKTVDDFHYQPAKLITRGEVAEFVYNYFGK